MRISGKFFDPDIELISGSIIKHLIRLALPSIAGMFSITVFNLTDTYFVSQLGTEALAAMGFTFPVILVVGAISSGISMGAASLLSRAKGAGDFHKMQRIATDGILLSLLFVGIISIIGIFTMDQVFTLLGAEPEILPLVKKYMVVWYAFVVVCVTPPVSDSTMRASGDMIHPFFVMLIIAVMNIVLDPLFIHGYWFFPRMGIQGAAVATVISRAIGMFATLYFVHHQHHLISFKYKNMKELLKSWKGILKIGIPGVSVQLMPQLLRSVITMLVAASSGTVAVAAIAVGTRIESFVSLITFGVGLAIVPIIGQNWGARKFERVHKMKIYAIRFALIYGVLIFVIFILLAKPVSRIFTDNTEVISLSAYYLWIMLIGFIGMNLTNWISQIFTTIGHPRWTVLLNVAGTLGILIPFAYIGRYISGYIGILTGVMIGQLIIGVIAVILAKAKIDPVAS